MLKLHRVDSGYGAAQVLHGVSLEVGQGEVVCLLGSNGAGKSTTLMTILGLLRPTRGEIGFCGRSLQGMSTSDIVKTGLAIVPEGRRVFGPLTVFENLQVAAAACGVDGDDASVLEPVLELFPIFAVAWNRRQAPCRAGSSRCWPSPAPSLRCQR